MESFDLNTSYVCYITQSNITRLEKHFSSFIKNVQAKHYPDQDVHILMGNLEYVFSSFCHIQNDLLVEVPSSLLEDNGMDDLVSHLMELLFYEEEQQNAQWFLQTLECLVILYYYTTNTQGGVPVGLETQGVTTVVVQPI